MSNEAIQKCENSDGACGQATENSWVKPVYRAEKSEHNYSVRVFMPGVTKSGVNVSLEKDVLTVEGVRSDTVEESWQPVFQEIDRDSYRLQLNLNVDIDAEKIEANVTDGVLTLTLPVAEEAKPKSILVS